MRNMGLQAGERVGVQQEGTSHGSIKQMAMHALQNLPWANIRFFADIGTGQGDSSRWFWHKVEAGYLLDHENHAPGIPPHIRFLASDLNHAWPIDNHACNFAVSLEVIEHLENPRHFFRELYRILKQGGYAFISTPHNLNLIARLLFLCKGQHRFFQDYSYPAHITALLPVDIERIAGETGFRILSTHYNYFDVLPVWKRSFSIRSPLFSNSIGFLLQKI